MEPIRSAQHGTRMVVLGRSKALDNSGHKEPQAYWVATSQNAGETWAFHYTGLHQGHPYRILPGPGKGLLGAKELQVEALHEPQPEYLQLAQPGTREVSTEAQPVLLTVPWRS